MREELKAELSWNEYFMQMAELTAKRSKDPKTRVGCVIIDPEENHVVSIGYNGFPKGMKDHADLWNSNSKHHYVVHAEANAILNTNADLHGKVIFSTMFPCNECAKLIAQKGIKKVFYHDDKFEHKDGLWVKEIFNFAGVEIEKL